MNHTTLKSLAALGALSLAAACAPNNEPEQTAKADEVAPKSAAPAATTTPEAPAKPAPAEEAAEATPEPAEPKKEAAPTPAKTLKFSSLDKALATLSEKTEATCDVVKKTSSKHGKMWGVLCGYDTCDSESNHDGRVFALVQAPREAPIAAHAISGPLEEACYSTNSVGKFAIEKVRFAKVFADQAPSPVVTIHQKREWTSGNGGGPCDDDPKMMCRNGRDTTSTLDRTHDLVLSPGEDSIAYAVLLKAKERSKTLGPDGKGNMRWNPKENEGFDIERSVTFDGKGGIRAKTKYRLLEANAWKPRVTKKEELTLEKVDVGEVFPSKVRLPKPE